MQDLKALFLQIHPCTSRQIYLHLHMRTVHTNNCYGCLLSLTLFHNRRSLYLPDYLHSRFPCTYFPVVYSKLNKPVQETFQGHPLNCSKMIHFHCLNDNALSLLQGYPSHKTHLLKMIQMYICPRFCYCTLSMYHSISFLMYMYNQSSLYFPALKRMI